MFNNLNYRICLIYEALRTNRSNFYIQQGSFPPIYLYIIYLGIYLSFYLFPIQVSIYQYSYRLLNYSNYLSKTFTHSSSDRQIDRQIDRQKDMYLDRHIDRWMIDRQIDDRQIYRQIDGNFENDNLVVYSGLIVSDVNYYNLNTEQIVFS